MDILVKYPSVGKEEKFLNLKGKSTTVKPERWYNLDTSRHICKTEGKNYLIKPRVAGSNDKLVSFLEINKFTSTDVIIPEHLREILESILPGTSVSNAVRVHDRKRPTTKTITKTSKSTKIATSSSVFEHPSLLQPSSFLNLTGRQTTVNEHTWFNLETSRHIKKLDGRAHFIQPRVSGPIELLVQFMIINNLSISSVVLPDEALRHALNSILMNRKSRVITCTDIDRIPQNEVAMLKPFTFDRITVKSIITNIVDGDTFDCAMVIDPYQMAMPIAIRQDSRTIMGQNCIMCASDNRGTHDVKMLITLRVRLFGCDAADAATKQDLKGLSSTAAAKMKALKLAQKDAATEFVRQWSLASGNKIWLQLMGMGCRSRTLGRIFQRTSDGHKSDLDLTTALLSYSHPKLGKVAVPYDGGNKEEAWS
jgi:hypothetical protein